MQLKTMGRAVRNSVAGLPREFWWLWTSTLINRLGGFVATFMAIYLTTERGFSASYAGLVIALYGLGGVVSSVGAGVLTDRLGRRPTLLIAQLASAVTTAALGFMTHPVAIALVTLLVGMATNASRPAVQAMMADIVHPEDRVRAFALNYWAINLGFGVSAMAAGFVAEVSYLAGFLGDATMTLICALVIFAKLPESRPSHGLGVATTREGASTAGIDGGSAARKTGDPGVAGPEGYREIGLGTVLRDGRFMSVVGLCFITALIFQQSYVGLPVAMAHAGLSPADYGLGMAVNGLLIVIAQIPLSRLIEHRNPRHLLIASALLAGYGFGLTAFAGSAGAFALTVCVWTLGEIINAPTQASLVVALSPRHARGRYQGVYSLSWSVATLVAPLLAGSVVDRFGTAWLWTGCALVGTAAAVGYGMLIDNLAPERSYPTATVGPVTQEPDRI